MDRIEYFVNVLTIEIGIAVATFLLNTKRILKAIELLKECLFIRNTDKSMRNEFVRMHLGVRGVMFQAYMSINDRTSAMECVTEMLVLSRESGGSYLEGARLGYILGYLYQIRNKYEKAKELYMCVLRITTETHDKELEGACYERLGTIFQLLGKTDKAVEYHQIALKICIEIGHKRGEAASHGNLGTVFRSLGKYDTAEECLQKALKIYIEIGHKQGEAEAYGDIGTVFRCLGKIDTAEEYLQKAFKIHNETGHKEGVAKTCNNLGHVFRSLGKYDKAEEYLQKALTIHIEFGDKQGEAAVYGDLGTVLFSLDKYDKAEEYLQKALKIHIEIGYKQGEASDYHKLGNVFLLLGKYDKAEDYLQKALQINIEIGHKEGEAVDYGSLGNLYYFLEDYPKAKAFQEKCLSLAYKIGGIELQFRSHLNLTWVTLNLTGNIDEAVSCLIKSIEKSEELQTYLKGNDDFKMSSLDMHVSPYKFLCDLLSLTGKFNEALYVAELARARALADMMSDKYFVQQEISANPQSWVGIERIVRKEIDSAFLYLSYRCEDLFVWIIKGNEPVVFRRKDVNCCFSSSNGEKRTVDEVFGDISLRNFLPLSIQEHCEDRSLFPSTAGSSALPRPLEQDEDANHYSEPPSLAQCYKMIIDPVVDLLHQPEIIIVPEGPLYKVPFAAFKDENERYLSESFRIRIVPSLTTLKLIQDSAADYHSRTGTLIIGDPEVGVVIYKKNPEQIRPLPCAREEAEMIGRLLGVQPLIGEHATKQAVLSNIHSVSLIHFAAHGDRERGEIALAPMRPFNGTPQEKDYLLTMAEIAQVRLRAKLVVLSCCHSAEGEIRSEGVVGIARAFLGAGARSVLVALWAIDDEATMQFMSRFYEHLVRGESASESLHQAMKWMRSHRFSNARKWAPFMLIGDNVTFDFKK